MKFHSVRRVLALLALVSMLSAGAPAPAAATAAESQACAAALAGAGTLYSYRVSDSITDTLPQGYRNDITLTLYGGNDYAIFACGDSQALDVDLYLYDENGDLVASDRQPDAQPIVEVTSHRTGSATARVVMHDTTGGSPPYYTFVILYRAQ